MSSQWNRLGSLFFENMTAKSDKPSWATPNHVIEPPCTYEANSKLCPNKVPRAYFTRDPGLRRKSLHSVLVYILYLHKNILFFLDQSPATSQSHHEPHCVLLCPLQHLLPRDSPMANSRRSSYCIPRDSPMANPRRSSHCIPGTLSESQVY